MSPSERFRRQQIQIEGAWIKRIKLGDVLRSRSGVLRVVRAVQHTGPSIPKTYITLAIKRCSWTHRCYTVLNGNDLRQMGFRPTRARVALRKRIDKAIEADFGAVKPALTCCDVAGVG